MAAILVFVALYSNNERKENYEHQVELFVNTTVKRLVTPTTDLSFDSVYAPFGQVPAERVLSPEVIGITDPLAAQIRKAAYQVGTGAITIDEAVSGYGSF